MGVKSTYIEVVNEVSAESALEYAAATSPRRNNMPIYKGVLESLAMAENNMSGLLNAMLFVSAYIYSSAPRNKKIRLTKIKTLAMLIMFF